jgi:hypothetical protein
VATEAVGLDEATHAGSHTKKCARLQRNHHATTMTGMKTKVAHEIS